MTRKTNFRRTAGVVGVVAFAAAIVPQVSAGAAGLDSDSFSDTATAGQDPSP